MQPAAAHGRQAEREAPPAHAKPALGKPAQQAQQKQKLQTAVAHQGQRKHMA